MALPHSAQSAGCPFQLLPAAALRAAQCPKRNDVVDGDDQIADHCRKRQNSPSKIMTRYAASASLSFLVTNRPRIRLTLNPVLDRDIRSWSAAGRDERSCNHQQPSKCQHQGRKANGELGN